MAKPAESLKGQVHSPGFAVAILVVAIAASVVVAEIVVLPPPEKRCPATLATDSGSLIRHLFILVQENHAFENYFGDYPGVIGYPPNGSFPVSFNSTQTVSPFALVTNSTPSFGHDRSSDLIDWNHGENNLFVAEANASGVPSPADAVAYYTSRQLAGYFELAKQYGLGDRFFTGVMGPTAPNRVFDITGYSGNGWYTDSPPPASLTSEPTILGQLADFGIPWAYDYAGTRQNLAPTLFPAIEDHSCLSSRIVPAEELSLQVRAPAVPSVVYVDSSNSPNVSEHPEQNISTGEAWTITNVDTILESPVGASSLVLVFYDEAGGFWDPLPPPMTSTGLDGFRVPFIAISPWTDPGTVCSTVLDPASVLHFIDENWHLPFLNSRVADAPGLGCFLDLSSPPRGLVTVSPSA